MTNMHSRQRRRRQPRPQRLPPAPAWPGSLPTNAVYTSRLWPDDPHGAHRGPGGRPGPGRPAGPGPRQQGPHLPTPLSEHAPSCDPPGPGPAPPVAAPPGGGLAGQPAPGPMTTATLPKDNDPCWCGSGQKFKRCHKGATDAVRAGRLSATRVVPDDIERPPYAATGDPPDVDEPTVKTADVIERMRRSCRLAADVLVAVGQ